MGILRTSVPWLVRRLKRPTSKVAIALPWIATAMAIFGVGINRLSGFSWSIGLVLWAVLLAGHLPVILLRHHFTNVGLIEPDRFRKERRLHFTTLIAFLFSALLLRIPLPAIAFFLLFRTEFNQLARRVPIAPVDYYYLPHAEIGPFDVDRVRRFPGHVVIEIADPRRDYWWYGWHEKPESFGTVFILEDDPNYPVDFGLTFPLGGHRSCRAASFPPSE